MSFADEMNRDLLADQQTALSRALAAELEEALAEIEQLKLRLNTTDAYAPIAGIEWRAQGDADEYFLHRGSQWIAHVRMNGGLTVSEQEEILSSMLEGLTVQAYKAKASEVFERVASYCAGSEAEFLIHQALAELNNPVSGGAQ